MHPPGDFGITKNYRRTTLTSIAAKVHYALPHNHIEPEIENILRKTQHDFRGNRSTASQILYVRRIIEGIRAKGMH